VVMLEDGAGLRAGEFAQVVVLAADEHDLRARRAA
jgi:hypothetical protein